jgi:two-component system OmpR family response regulator
MTWRRQTTNDYGYLRKHVSLRRKIDKGRASMMHTVCGVGYAIRPVEDGR